MEPTVRPSIPTASAVSINIFEPKAYSGAAPEQICPMPQQAPYYYNIPQASMYNMPTQATYQYPAAPMPQGYMPPQAPMSQPAPAAPVAPPPPSVIEQQPAPAPAPVPVQAEAPAPAPQPQAAAPAPEVKPAPAPAAQQAPAVDLQAIVKGLASANPDEQTAAIQKVAEIGQSNTEQVGAVLNEQVFQGLANLITKDKNEVTNLYNTIAKDTSKMQGPEKEKAELDKQNAAKVLTNMQIGMWTLAVLQKNFRTLIDAEAQKQNVPPISIREVPGIVQIVNNVKDNPVPELRAAAINALTFIAKPEDADVVGTILTIAAQKDPDANVKAEAQKALAELQKAPAAAPAQQAPAQPAATQKAA